LASPFRNILRLSVGDAAAKALNFLAFVYLARVLGTTSFGVLEFGNTILAYFLVFGDGGLELWATREAARTPEVATLAGRVLPLRLLMTLGSCAVLVALLPLLRGYPWLGPVLLLLGLSLFALAANLKWSFMGREKMALVAWGLFGGQVVFAAGVIAFVHGAGDLLRVPLVRLASELAMTGCFAWLFFRAHGAPQLPQVRHGTAAVLRPALTMGASHALAQVNYNFDSLLLGFLRGASDVGMYSVAYRPVTVALGLPVTYFLGLFPTLSRAFAESLATFRGIVNASLRLAAAVSVPVGVAGTLLADPVIRFLFGPRYAPAASALQLLSWSAVLVMLRGTFRQALNAAGRPELDLRCAISSSSLNFVLNILLIPRYGIVGAATATVAAEVLWLLMAAYSFHKAVAQVRLLSHLLRPLVAGIIMGTLLLATWQLFWMLRAVLSLLAYFGSLQLFKETRLSNLAGIREE
jgi:O-antigen/teichoic acid export membrane protein